jgi:hypothetical protein
MLAVAMFGASGLVVMALGVAFVLHGLLSAPFGGGVGHPVRDLLCGAALFAGGAMLVGYAALVAGGLA